MNWELLFDSYHVAIAAMILMVSCCIMSTITLLSSVYHVFLSNTSFPSNDSNSNKKQELRPWLMKMTAFISILFTFLHSGHVSFILFYVLFYDFDNEASTENINGFCFMQRESLCLMLILRLFLYYFLLARFSVTFHTSAFDFENEHRIYPCIIALQSITAVAPLVAYFFLVDCTPNTINTTKRIIHGVLVLQDQFWIIFMLIIFTRGIVFYAKNHLNSVRM